MLNRNIQRITPPSSATGAPTPSSATAAARCKELSERRRVLEQARTLNVRRIQQEVQRIAQREVEYAQRLLSEYAPVQLSLNESAWARLQELLPIRIVPKEPAVATPSPVPVTDDETTPSPDAPIA